MYRSVKKNCAHLGDPIVRDDLTGILEVVLKDLLSQLYLFNIVVELDGEGFLSLVNSILIFNSFKDYCNLFVMRRKYHY